MSDEQRAMSDEMRLLPLRFAQGFGSHARNDKSEGALPRNDTGEGQLSLL